MIFFGKYTDFRMEQPLNKFRQNLGLRHDILCGSVIVLSEEHPEKTLQPRLFTFGGSVILLNEKHPEKT